MPSFYEFFAELQSYVGVAPDLAGSRQFLSGIGRRALDTTPDIFNRFGDIKDVLELRWVWSQGFSPSSDHSTAFAPYSFNKKTGENSLFLPVTQIDMPFSAVSGDIKSFRMDYGNEPVNMVVYRDNPPAVVTIGLYLRNDTMSPWVAVFSRALESVIGNSSFVYMIVPRYNRDELRSNTTEYKVRVRIVNFTVGNAMTSVTPAALTLLPYSQGQSLLRVAGVQ